VVVLGKERMDTPDWCSAAFAGLNTRRAPVVSAQMKLALAFLVWILMAVVLVVGCVMAVHGKFWLLGLGVTAFLVLMAKYGFLSHD
jgi:hypothetical protein